MSSLLSTIQGYPDSIVNQVESLIKSERFVDWFDSRYPERHQIKSEKALFNYATTIKNQYLKKSVSVHKVVYDGKIHVINNALGLHTFVSRNHGGKLKAKNEIRITKAFKDAPEPLLRMLIVHELAHLKEREHNKGFYSLCCHMEADYHQLEFDARLYMIYLQLKERKSV